MHGDTLSWPPSFHRALATIVPQFTLPNTPIARHTVHPSPASTPVVPNSERSVHLQPTVKLPADRDLATRLGAVQARPGRSIQMFRSVYYSKRELKRKASCSHT